MNFAHIIFEGSFKMKIKKAIAHTNASNFLYSHKTIIQKKVIYTMNTISRYKITSLESGKKL